MRFSWSFYSFELLYLIRMSYSFLEFCGFLRETGHMSLMNQIFHCWLLLCVVYAVSVSELLHWPQTVIWKMLLFLIKVCFGYILAIRMLTGLVLIKKTWSRHFKLMHRDKFSKSWIYWRINTGLADCSSCPSFSFAHNEFSS